MMTAGEQDDIIQQASDAGDPASAEQAIQCIDNRLESITTPEDRVGLLLSKAVFLGILSRFDDARAQIKNARSESIAGPAAALECDCLEGRLLAEEDKASEAYEKLTATLKKHSKRLSQPDSKFILEQIQKGRAFALFRLGRCQDAEPLLREVLTYELRPAERVATLSQLGIGYSHLNDQEAALQYLSEACRAGPPDEWAGHVHFFLGLTYAHLKRLPESKSEFQKSLRWLPTPETYAWLAKICDLLGEREEAQHFARVSRPS